MWQAKSGCAGAALAMLGTSPRSAVYVLITDQKLASLGYRRLGQVLVACTIVMRDCCSVAGKMCCIKKMRSGRSSGSLPLLRFVVVNYVHVEMKCQPYLPV